METIPKMPMPADVPLWGIGAMALGGVGAYLMAKLASKRKAKMTKSERMFFTVVRVLQEEIDRLTDDNRALTDREASSREQFDTLVRDLRRERDTARDTLRAVEEQLAAAREELALPKRPKGKRARV